MGHLPGQRPAVVTGAFADRPGKHVVRPCPGSSLLIRCYIGCNDARRTVFRKDRSAAAFLCFDRRRTRSIPVSRGMTGKTLQYAVYHIFPSGQSFGSAFIMNIGQRTNLKILIGKTYRTDRSPCASDRLFPVKDKSSGYHHHYQKNEQQKGLTGHDNFFSIKLLPSPSVAYHRNW